MSGHASNQFSAIILAGGEGRRAGGVDKGLLELEHKPLVQHVLDSISPHVDDIIISANRHLERYKEFSSHVIHDDSDSYRGPLAGISACLPFCRHEHVLVCPCDMPYLTGEVIERMTRYPGNYSQGMPVTIAQCHGRLQLVMLINKHCLNSINQALAQNELSVMRWVQQQAHDVVDFEQVDFFTNLNEGL